MTRRFWNWDTPPDPSISSSPGELSARRVLRIGGVIAEDSWFDDDVTPGIFRAELEAGEGPVDVWINSPGGDCIAAAQIYTMLMDYPHPVRVIIDGLAASAASVIAMAGSEVLMSPPAMMIHNPATLANGDAAELARAIDMLAAVKDSIITAYEIKTSMQRARIGRLMDEETWMDARAAINLGFADAIYNPTGTPLPETKPAEDGSEGEGVVFSAQVHDRVLVNKLATHTTGPAAHLAAPAGPHVSRPVRVPAPGASLTQPTGRKVADLYAALADRPH